MMDWTTKVQLRALTYSVFKVLLFPLWFPIWILLWPISYTYKAEKAKALASPEVFVHGKKMTQSQATFDIPIEIKEGDAIWAAKPKSDKLYMSTGKFTSTVKTSQSTTNLGWTITLVNAGLQQVYTQTAVIGEDAKARADFLITKTDMVVRSILKFKGRVVSNKKLSVQRNGNYGVDVQKNDTLKMEHDCILPPSMDDFKTAPALEVEIIGPVPKSAEHFVLDGKVKEKILELHKRSYNVMGIAQQTNRSREYVKEVLGLKEEKRSAIITVLDSCGKAMQQIEINGNIFDQSIKYKTFVATSRAKKAFVVGAFTLSNYKGEEVVSRKEAYCLARGDTYTAKFVLGDADISKLIGELKWQGVPLSRLEDGRLYNIHQAILKGCWADGALISFALPMQRALIAEYASRRFKKKHIRKFIEQNETWKAANT